MKALRDADASNPTAKFLGRDPTKYAPKVGDLINAGRGPAAAITYNTVRKAYGEKVVPKGAFMPSHSDIVVMIKGNSLTTVGGNVSVDTVNKKNWKLAADGTLAKGSDLICVIECVL